nr:unnamed protein product [Spirometra erinaceieuropaei]
MAKQVLFRNHNPIRTAARQFQRGSLLIVQMEGMQLALPNKSEEDMSNRLPSGDIGIIRKDLTGQPDVSEFLTFYGRKPGTRAFFDSPVYSVILDIFQRWNTERHSDRQQLENAFKNAFKKCHDRYQRKCHRASLSRQTNDRSSNIEGGAD